MKEKILLFDSKGKKFKRMEMSFETYLDYFMFCIEYKIGTFEYHDGSKGVYRKVCVNFKLLMIILKI